MNVRASAAQVIFDIIVSGRSLTDVLPKAATAFTDPRDRALLQAICYGVCRWFHRLDSLTRSLLEKPLKQKDLDVYALLLVGLYQLTELRIPDYAAVTETVAATKGLKKVWAKGLVNGVLRQYLRDAEELNENDGLEFSYSHPRWLLERLQQDYPDYWQDILTENNEHPPFTLRVNQQRITRAKYLEKLSAANIDATAVTETAAGVVLDKPIDVQHLPGFDVGEVSVQDGAAQLAAELLMLEPGQRVLDACAAPGGKTAHILELQPTVECVAVDNDAERLVIVKENLQRLRLSATCIAADVAAVDDWWDGKLFDRILLDAPCSATGVIRRHPDIKLLRRGSDISRLAQTQLHLLNAVWPLLAPNGVLLYATCSVFAEENSQVIQQFLAMHPDVKEEKIDLAIGVDATIGKQILPGMHGMDGFYFARLRK